MATTDPTTGERLQELAKRSPWLQFSRMGACADHDVRVIVRGDGCYELSPPLIAGPEQVADTESILPPALEEASRRERAA